jgi:hypothetical protein
MTSEPSFPITASPLWIFGILLVSILVFHVAFLLVWKLERLGWKVIDYIWLSVAALGLFSAAGEVRRLRAENLVAERRISATAAYGRFMDEARLLTSPAICRNFNQSEPVLPKKSAIIKAEYDNVCKYGHDLQAILPLTPPQDLAKLEWPDRPFLADPMLIKIFSSLVRLWQNYSTHDEALNKALIASRRSNGEDAFIGLSPLLLAVALALRITKVSGEIRLDHSYSPAPAVERMDTALSRGPAARL